VLAARYEILRQPGHDLGGSLSLNLLVRPAVTSYFARVFRPS
jgi:hypothetical protein